MSLVKRWDTLNQVLYAGVFVVCIQWGRGGGAQRAPGRPRTNPFLVRFVGGFAADEPHQKSTVSLKI